jgi:hypothetical protein
MSKLIIVPSLGDNAVSIDASAEKIKSELLAKLEVVKTSPIISIETRDKAIEVVASVSAHLKEVERQRLEFKKPFWSICQAIDLAARQHIDGLTQLIVDIETMIGRFNQIEEERVKALKAAMSAAPVALEDHAAAAAAELAKLEADPSAPIEAVLEAEERAERAKETVFETQREAATAIVSLERSSGPKGGRKQMDTAVEITDINALFQAHPECVRLEPDIPLIKRLNKNGVALPGVKITETPRFSVRAAK